MGIIAAVKLHGRDASTYSDGRESMSTKNDFIDVKINRFTLCELEYMEFLYDSVYLNT